MSAEARGAQVYEGERATPGAQDAGAAAVEVFEKWLDAEREPWLRDHWVQGRAVLPAGAIAEMALAAGRCLLSTPLRLRNLSFLAPLAVDVGRPALVTLELAPAGAGWSLVLRRASGSSEEAAVHARGWLEADDSLPPAAVGDAWLDAEAPRVPIDAFYSSYARRGIRYGETFQLLRELRRQGDRCWASLELGAGGTTRDPALCLPPGVADAALQVLAALAPERDAAGRDLLTVPFSIGALRWQRRPGAAVHVRARRIHADEDGLRGDVTLLDPSGDVLAELADVQLRRVGAPRASRPAQRGPVPLHRWLWSAQPLEWQAQPPAGSWLILVDRHGVGAELARRLERSGASCTLVQLGESFEQLGLRHLRIRPDSDADHERAVQSAAGAGPLVGVLHLLGLCTDCAGDAAPPAAPESPEALVVSAHALVRALARARLGRLPLYWIGANASAAAGGAPSLCPASAALWGFARSAAREEPALLRRCIALEREPASGERGAASARAERIWAELCGEGSEEVVYTARGRLVPRLEPLATPALLPARRSGAFLITGGLGGLGLALARHLAAGGARLLVLVGRTALGPPSAWPALRADPHADPALRSRIEALESLRGSGVEVWAEAIDCADEAALRALVERVASHSGALRGALHLAAHAEDGLIRSKTPDAVRRVLHAKLAGARALAAATAAVPLDFLAFFSSATAVFGNVGQADYGAANAFVEAFAAELCAAGRPAVAIAWGLWREIGMGTQLVDTLRERGFDALGTEEALAAFDAALASGETQLVAARFHGEGPRSSLLGAAPRALAAAAPLGAASGEAHAPAAGGAALLEALARLLEAELKLSGAALDPDASFAELGIDSILGVRLVSVLERAFSVSLKPTLFFDYATARELAGGLLRDFGVRAPAPASAARPAAAAPTAAATAPALTPAPALAPMPALRAAPGAPRREAADGAEPIAVIGLAGRFPGAADAEALWRNLARGVDCVTEVPAERWDVSRWFSADRSAAGRTYSRWGGFLGDLDQFDPALFRISAREARCLDPQQRLLLETCWEAIEDSGHAGESLSRASTGVFIGASYQHHRDQLGLESVDVHSGLGNLNAMLANRVSYCLDLCGPSLTVDTLCSSSLVALHLAVQSLRRGECDFAIAGGVHAALSPWYYRSLSRLGALSARGRSRAFDAGADGYVPGEGVAAVVLRRLDAAARRRDRIWGVLRGSAVSHGARASGLTVPRASAQARVIAQALAEAGVSAREIGLLEAHGTGTALGDPIEIDALGRVYGEQTADRQFCAIGSLKSNLGHLEPAAGVASLIKVLLAMRERTLPPTLHAERPNPRISFEATPFYWIDRARPWRGETLRAGVSAFGMGGVNAHVIVEEAPRRTRRAAVSAPGPRVLKLSAQSASGLQQLAARYRAWLADHPELELADLCLTANTGRADLSRRCALVFESRGELLAQLARAERGEPVGAATPGALAPAAQPLLLRLTREAPAAPGESAPPAVELLQGADGAALLAALGASWSAGGSVDWEALEAALELREQREAQRVALPRYPFERERFGHASAQRAHGAPQAAPLEARAGEALSFWTWDWQRLEAPRPARSGAGERWWVFVDERGLGQLVARRLCESGARVLLWRAVPGARAGTGENREIDPDQAGELAAALAAAARQERPAGVLDFWALQAADAAGERGADPLRAALRFQAVARALGSALGTGADSSIAVVTDGAQPLGAGPHSPAAAAVLGLVRGLAQESTRLRWRALDVALAADGAAPLGLERLAAQVCGAALEPAAPSESALRRGELFAPRLVPARTQPGRVRRLRPGGVVLITGGLGGLGAHVAAHLAAQGARVVVVGRTPLAGDPDAARDAAERERWRALCELQARGAVEYACADVSDAAAVSALLARVKQRHGALHGVVHAAGAADRLRSLLAKEPGECARVLSAKALGAWHLGAGCRGEDLDFFLLFSSIASFGGPLARGLADYAAANAFLNQLARELSGRGLPALSVAWPQWRETGMARGQRAAGAALGLEPLSALEGVQALEALFDFGAELIAPLRVRADFDPQRLLGACAADAQAPSAPPQPAEAAALAGREDTAERAPEAVDFAPAWQLLREVLSEVLESPADSFQPGSELAEVGLDSLLLTDAVVALERRLGRPVEPGILLGQRRLGELAERLAREFPALPPTAARAQAAPLAPTASPEVQTPSSPAAAPAASRAPGSAVARPGAVFAEPIAVVGYACRLPDGDDAEQFWRTLAAGRDAVREVPESRWPRETYYSADPLDPVRGYGRWAALRDDIYDFDPEFFGLSESEAIALDPQQRIMLEVAQHAFDHAACSGGSRRVRTGVFIGARMNDYGRDYWHSLRAGAGAAYALDRSALLGRSPNFAAAWISDRLDLQGPSLVVDTACSSSLVALHLACQSLRLGECELALAGGVDLLIDPLTLPLLSKAQALSPDGRCRVFDRRANGYVPGEGAVALLLKPLALAQRDGDAIRALILATATNNDGRTVGVTTPSQQAQIELLAQIYGPGGLDPGSVTALEAHGTGTAIGDPIEIRALTEVFRRGTERSGYCAIGSVKTNVGHLHSAAGAAGALKLVLALERAVLPATLNCEEPNPRFEFLRSPFYPNVYARPWRSAAGAPRRAGVSSFGFGGSNAHLVLEQAPPAVGREPEAQPRELELLLISSHRAELLAALAGDYARALREGTASWRDFAWSSRVGRRHERERLAIAAHSAAEAVAELEQWLARPARAPEAERGRAARQLWLQACAALAEPQLELLCARWPAFARGRELGRAALRAALAAGAGGAGGGESFAGVCAAVYALRDWGVPAAAIAGGPLVQVLARSAGDEVALQAAALRWLCEGGEPDASAVPGSAELFPTGVDPLGAVLRALGALYRAGADVEWTRIDAPGRARRTALPAVRFARRALRLPQPGAAPRRHPLLDRAAPGEDGVLCFERSFSSADVYLRDHQVLGQCVLPGVTWLELVRAAAELGKGWDVRSFSQVHFARPLVVKAGERAGVRGTLDAEGRFQIAHAASGEILVEGWARSAAAARDGGEVEPLSVAELEARSLRRADGERVYAQLRALGYLHGPFFRNIAWMSSLGEHETFARLRRASDPAEAELRLHPGLLDSATIAGFGDAAAAVLASGGRPFIPVFIGELHWYRPLPEELCVHTRIAVWNSEMNRCTQLLATPEGEPCLRIADLVSKRVRAGTLEAEPAANGAPAAHARAPLAAAPGPERGAGASEPGALPGALEWLAQRLGSEVEFDAHTPFLSLGLDSAGLVKLARELERELAIELYPTLLFEHPTPAALVAHLAAAEPAALAARLAVWAAHNAGPQALAAAPPQPALASAAPLERAVAPASERAAVAQPRASDIAVIGMAGRYPGAADLGEYWRNLSSGRDCVGEIPRERWDWREHYGATPAAAGKTCSRWGGFLADVAGFDARFFGVAPSEAPLLDPQTRLFLEIAWETLEDAGYAAPGGPGPRTGVWVGYSHDHYYEERVRAGIASLRGLSLQSGAANQLSYFMNWRGPSQAINTLCSSSLVALHAAVQSLRAGECDTALVGGVHLGLTPEYYAAMTAQGALSASGRCRAFDARADGYVPGEGVGAVLLKPLRRALADGDRICGVLKGSAVNHGGRASRLSAPNPDAQAEVIQQALAAAGVAPERITYVEAHGTGTALGDPIEVVALARALAAPGFRRADCALGAVKTQIGHLESAAGIAGLHKVLLCLQQRTLAPSLHLESPNPALNLLESRFYLSDRARPWPGPGPRCAGVSSFGMLGANAHAVLEEAPEQDAGPAAEERPGHLLCLSARGEPALRELAQRYAHWPGPGAGESAGDAAFTANTGRTHFEERLAVWGESWPELRAAIQAWLSGSAGGSFARGRRGKQPPRVAVLFTGQGSQWAGMGRDLYESQPLFRSSVDRSARELSPVLGADVRELMWGQRGGALRETWYAQPALFALEWGLWELWQSWGVQASWFLGHSVGEYAAVAAAGGLSREEALWLVAERGRLMREIPAGAGGMAAVRLAREEVQARLAGWRELSVAAENAALETVVSGERAALERWSAEQRARGVELTALAVSHGFHSPQMDGIGESLERSAQKVDHRPLARPVVSNRSGRLLSAGEVLSAEYYRAQLRGCVEYRRSLATLLEAGAEVFLELGPQPVLVGLGAREHAGAEREWLGSLSRGLPCWRTLLASAGRLYARGVALDWVAFERPYSRRRIALPTYPFQRQRYWVGESGARVGAVDGDAPSPLLGERIR